MIIQVTYVNGATVRSGVEIEGSAVVRMLQYGDVLEAYQRGVTREGIPRYQIADGWVSGKLRGGNEDPVVSVLREVYPEAAPARYKVARDGGAKLRAGPTLSSADLGVVPAGTALDVAERRVYYHEGQVRIRVATRRSILSGMHQLLTSFACRPFDTPLFRKRSDCVSSRRRRTWAG
jgi:hypothetical protein